VAQGIQTIRIDHVAKTDELRKRFLSQANGVLPPRVWPDGRLNGSDDGQLSVAIAVDPVRKAIIMHFGMPVAWVGLDAESARGLIARLEEHLKTIEG